MSSETSDFTVEWTACSFTENSEGVSDVEMCKSGQSDSELSRNLGPFNQLSILKVLAGSPLEAESAGFKVDGTWRHRFTSLFALITANRLATKTGNRLV